MSWAAWALFPMGPLVQDEKIIAVSSSDELRAAYPDEPVLDAADKGVMPGFVDPHTHLIWAGNRAAEFELRLQGKTYLEILQAGGGILSTVQATRTSSLERLLIETRPRLWSMFSYGTTTAEAKTGYGLRTATELRMLQALLALDKEGPLEIVPTFLGHAMRPNIATNRMSILPWSACDAAHPANGGLCAPYCNMPFVDVFCETGPSAWNSAPDPGLHAS
jgi:imidazolonepropionase